MVAGIGGIFGAAPSASADELVHFDSEGSVSDNIEPGAGPLVCVNPHIKVFGNVLLEDPICLP